jgi:flagellar biosynthesis/type III secretory pathway protein FliH
LSSNKLILPTCPTSVGVFDGGLNEWYQRELEMAYSRGHNEALAGSCNLIAQAATRIDEARVEATREISSFATRFAASIAKHLLHIKIDEGQHEIEKMIREILAESGVGRGQCVVHVHPDDAQALSEVGFRKLTSIESDPEVPRGSIHVTTSEGLLVRDVDVCIQQAAERMHADLRSRAHATPDEQSPDA